MTGSFTPLIPATIAFDRGSPVSERYGDIYHSRSGALAQAERVFLQGNRLPVRWRARSSFTVCETGFGLGYNFLALYQAWRNDPDRPDRLHVVSFEAHPFSKVDLARMILPAIPGSLSDIAEQLVAGWPALTPGLHRLEFQAGAVTLTLAFGHVDRLARQIDAQVDAYFLDGFAPRKNPQMWTPSLFGQLVRMANAGATVASWCCAAQVRRDLADAGFLVTKETGLPPKGEMTVAVLRPGMGRAATVPRAASVLVVGGGLAGAGIAHGLATRGHRVTVLDPVLATGLGASHRGHRAAAMVPLVSADDDFRARLTRAGVSSARRRWRVLPPTGRPWRCGAIDLVDQVDASRRRSALACLAFPDDWVSWVDRRQASERIGFPVAKGGVFFADGCLLRPELLVRDLLSESRVRCLAARVAQIVHDKQGYWRAMDAAGVELAGASTVVLANAIGATGLLAGMSVLSGLPKLAAMSQLAGQVSYFSAEASGRDPRLIVQGDGYWLPSVDGRCVAGSTYVPAMARAQVTESGHKAVIGKIANLLDISASPAEQWLDRTQGWAGWRAVVNGRLPVIGPVAAAPGLWLASAFGSRGLTWSALAGEIIAARLGNEPAPIERELLRAIAPR